MVISSGRSHVTPSVDALKLTTESDLGAVDGPADTSTK